MSLTKQQKSAYSVIYNATQIARSLGKLKFFNEKKENTHKFKTAIFIQTEILLKKINSESLKNSNILHAIDEVYNQFSKKGVSFGQVQKPINVLLKFHFYLCSSKSNKVKIELDCPLDSIVLKSLGYKISLQKIDKKTYSKIQEHILHFNKNQFKTKIDADEFYDNSNTNF